MPDGVDDAAARWALRHPIAPPDQAAFDAWLAHDARHAGALLRAMAALSLVDRAIEPETQPAAAPPSLFGRRRILGGTLGAMAASIVGVIGWRQLVTHRVRTAQGEIRRLPLADGSVVTINTDSALRVAFAGHTRQVMLDRGQAWFQVAKDRTRPFVVDAGIAKARAIGTAFAVRRSEAWVEILVTEGVVAAWPTDADGTVTILEAGQFARFRTSALEPMTGTAPEAIDRSLAWRSGEIAFEDETVAAAVEQFNRYNHQKLVIVDPAIGRERLVGLFHLDKPSDFAATLARTYQLDVTTTPTEIRLSVKKTALP